MRDYKQMELESLMKRHPSYEEYLSTHDGKSDRMNKQEYDINIEWLCQKERDQKEIERRQYRAKLNEESTPRGLYKLVEKQNGIIEKQARTMEAILERLDAMIK